VSLSQPGRWALLVLIQQGEILHELTGSTTVAEARK
jgi:hypothetical protein